MVTGSRSDVIRESYNFNCGLIPAKVGNVCGTWFTVNSSAVVLETVKPSEPALDDDKRDDRKILIRLFESCGDRTNARFPSMIFNYSTTYS